MDRACIYVCVCICTYVHIYLHTITFSLWRIPINIKSISESHHLGAQVFELEVVFGEP